LLRDAPGVLRRHFPAIESRFAERGWKLPRSIDRVYVIEKAEKLLGYRPQFNFQNHLHEIPTVKKSVGKRNALCVKCSN
jgi:hypothetical protein